MVYRSAVKMPLDRFTACVAVILTFPLTLIVAVLSVVSQGGNPIFKQKRVGYQERLFFVYKFRTMNNRRDPDGNLLPDSERLTAFGSFLRKTSLDELPQLLNVAAGQMSFVGPRPLLVEYLPLYSAEQRRRHEVLPGITGWAQVNGRNQVSWSERFALDVYYVANQSFILDVKILLLTVLKVITSDGVSGKGVATMTKFKGNI